MKRTRKILAIALVLLMALMPLTLCAQAEESGGEANPKTVIYISAAGADTNDGKTEATAVKSLEAATAKVGKAGGEIVVTDDMELDVSSALLLASAHRIYLAATDSTVYLHGRKKADNSYPTLTLYASDNKAPCLELAGPLAIYDLNISLRSESNLWISANGYNFTSGANLTYKTADAKFSVKLCGGKQDATYSGSMPTGATPTLNIFGGNYGDIYGGSFAKGATVSGDTTINMLGGTTDNLLCMRKGGKHANTTINFYGGTVKTLIECYTLADGAVATLNIYNNSLNAGSDVIGEYFKAEDSKHIRLLTGTAPTFEELSAVTIQTPEPPDNPDETPGEDLVEDDQPSQGDKQPVTRTTEAPSTTTAAETEPAEESKGCKSSVSVGVLAVLLITGSGAVLLRRREN